MRSSRRGLVALWQHLTEVHFPPLRYGDAPVSLESDDEHGAPVNPLDDSANRYGAEGVAPSATFDPARGRFNLDRIVEANLRSNASRHHALPRPGVGPGSAQGRPGVGPDLRDGAADPDMAGPLGATLLRKLTNPASGVVLDSWLDADGASRGDAATHLAGQ